jgi:protoheme IX farnesyltransferase
VDGKLVSPSFPREESRGSRSLGLEPVAVPSRGRQSRNRRVGDLMALTKPRVMGLVLCTMSAGMLLAPGSLPTGSALLSILGTAGIVGACGCLNMYMERSLDARMDRTRSRPLPSGRVKPQNALRLGCLLLVASFPVLYAASNPITGTLGAFAVLIYLGGYTPLKTRTHLALFVGAIAGATPVLMGTTSIAGQIDRTGLTLFVILYSWQLQHFLSISLRYEDDYRKAGILAYPVVVGRDGARQRMVFFTLLFGLAALAPHWTMRAGGIHLLVATAAGISLLAASLAATRRACCASADRRHFVGAIVSLIVLLSALVIDANLL